MKKVRYSLQGNGVVHRPSEDILKSDQVQEVIKRRGNVLNTHSCSYHCHLPECIKAQRDELRDKLAECQRDAGRLEWLAREGYFIWTQPVDGYCSSVEYCVCEIHGYSPDDEITDYFGDWRQAIDAAMQESNQ